MSLAISDKADPRPTTLTTMTLYIRGLKDANGAPYDLSGASKIYATIKDNLADADNAHVNINNVSNPTQFVTTYASTGNLDVTFTSTNTTLTADTTYYVDVKAIWSGGAVLEIVRDTIVFDVPVTLAVS